MELVVIRLRGHLDAKQLSMELERANSHRAGSGRFILVVDCLEMEGYDTEARRSFTAWHADSGHDVEMTVVLTDRILWHTMVSAMSVAARKPMRAFKTRADAEVWLGRPIGIDIDASRAAPPNASPRAAPGTAQAGSSAPREAAALEGSAEPGTPQSGDFGASRSISSGRLGARTEVRGFVIQTLARALRRRLPSFEWGHLSRRIQLEHGVALEQVGSLAWCDSTLLESLLDHYAEHCEASDPVQKAEVMTQLGRFMLDDHLDSVLRLSVAELSASDLMVAIPPIWSRYLRGVEVEVSMNGPRGAVCEFRGTHEVRGLHPLGRGWLLRILERLTPRPRELIVLEVEDPALDMRVALSWGDGPAPELPSRPADPPPLARPVDASETEY